MAALTARISLDTSELAAQLDSLVALLEQIPKSRLEHAHGLCLGYQERMGLDVVFADHVTTTTAGGVVEIVQACRLGIEFENLVAALGAGDV